MRDSVTWTTIAERKKESYGCRQFLLNATVISWAGEFLFSSVVVVVI